MKDSDSVSNGFIISEEILEQTKHCNKDFSCLSGNKECLCEIKECVGCIVLFIKHQVNNGCNYKKYFGYSPLCTCPTRKEIYKQQKI
jgi:hypothetical protein